MDVARRADEGGTTTIAPLSCSRVGKLAEFQNTDPFELGKMLRISLSLFHLESSKFQTKAFQDDEWPCYGRDLAKCTNHVRADIEGFQGLMTASQMRGRLVKINIDRTFDLATFLRSCR